MPRHITKVSKSGGQYRLTLPKGIIEECKWQGVGYIILERMGFDEIRLRRFVDRDSLKTKDETDQPGSDR